MLKKTVFSEMSYFFEIISIAISMQIFYNINQIKINKNSPASDNSIFLFFEKKCCQFKTEYAQDVKKAEKLISQLMRHITSKEQ